MGDSAQCTVCQTLLEEFRTALAEVGASPKLTAELRTASEALRKLSGGTEEDAERADQVLRKFRPQVGGADPEYQPNGVGTVLRKMADHRARTGHMILFGK